MPGRKEHGDGGGQMQQATITKGVDLEIRRNALEERRRQCSAVQSVPLLFGRIYCVQFVLLLFSCRFGLGWAGGTRGTRGSVCRETGSVPGASATRGNHNQPFNCFPCTHFLDGQRLQT